MFRTSGSGGTGGEDVTAELALAVGRAVASAGSDRVVVGRDAREGSAVLCDALTAGLLECGTDVLEIDVASTPTVARAVVRNGADAGIVVTAADDPLEDRIELRSAEGIPFDPERLEAIATRIDRDEYDRRSWDGLGSIESLPDAVDRHAAELTAAVSIDGSPRVVVDAGTGAGGITARVLADLGCDVVALNGRQEGRFPGRSNEPTRAPLAALSAQVAATNAWLGIAHDDDADRMLAVDETGTFVPTDVLFALFARAAASDAEVDRPVVAATADTSAAVDDALATVGASVRRTPVGDAHVAERATDADVVFGGEPGGAWIWPHESPSPDGPLAACKLVELVAERGPLSELCAEIDTYPIRRRSIEGADATVVARVRDEIRERYPNADVDAPDGVRVDRDSTSAASGGSSDSSGGGWFHLCADGIEPVVRITAEGRTESRAEQLEAEAHSLLERATDARTRSTSSTVPKLD